MLSIFKRRKFEFNELRKFPLAENLKKSLGNSEFFLLSRKMEQRCL